MDKKLTKIEGDELDPVKPAVSSNEAMINQINKGVALCVGVLLSVLAYSLYPQSRLLVVAVSVFALIFVFMLVFWFVGLLKSFSNTGVRQPAKQESRRDSGA